MPKKKPGAPSKYDPDYCDKLIHHMSKGLSFESFAGVIHVDRDTLYEWVKVHSAFSDAKKKARALCLLWWEEQGIQGLYTTTTRDPDGGSQTIAINSAIWIYNMKCRFPKGWRERQEVKASVKAETTDSEQVRALLSELEKVRKEEG